jgi:hypothetical protein
MLKKVKQQSAESLFHKRENPMLAALTSRECPSEQKQSEMQAMKKSLFMKLRFMPIT